MAISLANPGFEVNTTGWTATGTSVFARDTGEFHSGVASAHIVFDGATAYMDVVCNAVSPPASGLHTFQHGLWLKGTGTVALRMRIWANGFANARDSSSTAITLSGTWTQYAVSGASLASDTIDAVTMGVAPVNWIGGGVTSAEVWIDDASISEIISGSKAIIPLAAGRRRNR